MKGKAFDLALTALAPLVWGSTYVVTTQYLAGYPPIVVALLRALSAGLLLLLFARQLPRGAWWARAAVLGALNHSVFLSLLFVAAYRLPGGVAATVSAVQPLFVVFLARLVLATPVRINAVIAALGGAAGVALLVLAPDAALDGVGVAAGLAGAASMALGTVLSQRWRPPVPPLIFAAWQLTAGGLLLVPVVLLLQPALPAPTFANGLALAWLGVIGMAATFVLWLRGLARLDAAAASSLLLLSPVSAAVLGWIVLGETLNPGQLAGALMVLGSIWLAQSAARNTPGRTAPGRVILQQPKEEA